MTRLKTLKAFLLLSTLFLMAQSTVQLHEVDHLFHNDGPNCMAFHSVQHHSGALFDHSFSIPVADASRVYHSIATYRAENIHHHFAASRAPPSV